MRTLIYARFSSTLQNSRSVDDQIALCRERADREGWTVVGIFSDHAISGAAGIDEAARPGLGSMLARIEDRNHPGGPINQVLAESTDRIARHQGDGFAIRERLTFAGVRLFTLSVGEVTDLTATFHGWADAQFRKDLGAKIRRGQKGAVGQGKAPAGIAYGYRKVAKLNERGEGVRGLRQVDGEQAAIVRRIFTEYAAGQSPRAICDRLNAERVPGPRGSIWRSTTLHGDRQRRNGMLQNELYIGQLVVGRTSKVTDPRTRRTLIRPNPESEWTRQAVPDLRIIDDALWQAVQAMRGAGQARRPELMRRPKHLLSGMATCGTCGGGWIVIGSGRWACSRHREGGAGACTNNRTITTPLFEQRVLAGLQDRMLDPELIEIYVREYHADYARRSADVQRSGDRLRRREREAAARVDRLVAALAGGGSEFEEIREAMQAAKAERKAAADELAQLDAMPVVALHPTIIADYRREVAELNRALASNPAAQLDAIPKLRALIDTITIVPSDKQKGVKIEVTGRLNAIIALATGVPEVECMVAVERVKGIEPSS